MIMLIYDIAVYFVVRPLPCFKDQTVRNHFFQLHLVILIWHCTEG